MGQKSNPTSLRLQLNKNWRSKWFASGSDYTKFLMEDLKLRGFIEGKLDRRAAVDHIDIERSPNQITIIIFTARPGMIIGRGGSGIEELKMLLQRMASTPIKVTIEEVKKPELRAQLVANSVAEQLERRMPFRRVVKSTVENSMKAGAKGIKVMISGRLGGIEMARTEKEIAGSIPLHTLRANIDYAAATAQMPNAGIIGIKIWIYKEAGR